MFFYHPKTISSKKLEIIYTGRIHPEKGLEILVEARKQLKQKYGYVQLSPMGPSKIEDGGGGNSYIEKLNKIAVPYLINWIEPVSAPRLLNERLVNSDIFCYLSIAEKGETFGVALLEAMATGTPAIVSTHTGAKDLISNGINGWIFFDGNVTELKNAILNVYENRHIINVYGKAAAETVREFTWDRYKRSI